MVQSPTTKREKTMSAGIVKNIDQGIVGYVEMFGKTWHQFPEYEMMDGQVPMEKALSTLDYKVAKVPLAFSLPDNMKNLFPADTNGKLAMTPVDPDRPDTKPTPMYALVRQDTGTNVFNVSVGEDFTIYQNSDFLTEIEKGLLSKYPELKIESAGSLFGGRLAFVNIILDVANIKKDCSSTVTRLMYCNAFGGRAIQACVHQTRVVCMNTLKISAAQGAANNTLKKFRHSKGVVRSVNKHLTEMAELKLVTEQHNAIMDKLAETQMSIKDVENFLSVLVPVKSDFTQRGESRAENKRDTILEIFETAKDLQGDIAGTRYAMFQSVTNYSQYQNVNKSTDKAGAWYDVVSGGIRHKFNQSALDILSKETIPEPPELVLVPAGVTEDDDKPVVPTGFSMN